MNGGEILYYALYTYNNFQLASDAQYQWTIKDHCALKENGKKINVKEKKKWKNIDEYEEENIQAI